MSYKVELSRKGIKVLVYTSSEGRQIRLNSAYNPEKEAERAAESFEAGRSGVIFVTGLGLGFHILALKRKFPNLKIYVIEESSEVIDICFKNNPKISDTIDGIVNSSDSLSSIFEEMDISTFKGFKVFYFNSSYSINPDFYDSIITDINQYVSSKVSDLLTRFEFEEIWARNIIKNIPIMTKSSSIKSFFGKFKSYPGIIVSAGPSLKKNADILKKLYDKAVIVCVDTALPVLRRFNIKPHFVITLDAQKHSIIHFLSDSEINPPLICDMVSCPAINRDYKGDIIVSSTAKYYDDNNGNLKREATPFMDWLEEFISPIGDIQSGGSVATSAFDLLLNLGCSSIVLAGQDLAYTGREIHSSGTHHNDNWLTITNRFRNLQSINQNIIRKRKIKYVPAFKSNDTVITDFVLDMYKQWFSDSAGRVEIPVINVTEGGASINNTKEMSFKSFSKTVRSNSRKPEEIIKDIISNKKTQSKETVTKEINNAINKLKKLNNKSKNCSLSDDNRFKEIYHDSEKDYMKKMLSPFMKKSNIYINRHNELTDSKVRDIFIKDIINSSSLLISYFENCLNKINRY